MVMLHPNSLFSKYKEKILKLEKIEQKNIKNTEFELYNNSDLKIFYAPHNEYINDKAKIIIVGITPGWTQTQRAYETAQNGLLNQLSDENICFNCKIESRFAGTMRNNLVSMLNELELQKQLDLSTCLELFDLNNDLLHTTSLIKYPCFYKEKNYSGHTPTIATIDILRKYVEHEFVEEMRAINTAKIIIPLGAAVEDVFKSVLSPSVFPESCCVLWGFPHPSGLNAHRKTQFQNNYKSMVQTLKKCSL